MSVPPPSVRAAVRALGRYRLVSRAVAAAALLYAIGLVLTGGFEISIGGFSLRSHEIDRAVMLAVIAGLLDVLGAERSVEMLWSFGGHVARAMARAVPIVLGLTAGVAVLGAGLWWLARVVRPMSAETPFADMALLEIYTRHAARNDLLLGPYSRFIWHHPGPAMFYMLRPLYQLSGERYESLRWSALVFNGLCLAALLEIVRRRAKPLLALTLAVALSFYLYRFPDLLASAWNPHLLIIPLGLLLVATAAALDGEPRCWVLVAFVASFLIQTHLSVAPTVAAIVLTAMVWLVADTPAPDLARRHRLWIGVSAWVVVLLWLPPLAEQLSSPSGNLAAIYRSFFQKPLAAPPLGEAFAASLNMLSASLVPGLEFALGGLVVRSVSLAGVVIAVGSLLAVPWTAGRLGRGDDRFGRALAVLCLVASLAAIWSVGRIQGEILDQLVFWITIIGLFTTACLIAAVAGSLGVRLGSARLVTALAVWAGVAISLGNGVGHLYTTHERWMNEPVAQRVKSASASLEAYLTQQDLHRPLVRIAQPTWGDATGIVLALQKSGLPVAIEQKWIFMYGTQEAATGQEDCEVILADAERRVALESEGRYTVVAEWPELSIHVARMTHQGGPPN